MFKIYSLVALFLAAASVVSAGGDLELCTKVDLSGHCVTFSYLNNECFNLGSDLEDKVRSVDPLDGDHKCTLFMDQDCEGDTYDFTKHQNDLGDFNDEASSFSCKNKD